MAVLQIVFKGQDEVAGASRQVADDLRGVGHAADEAKSSGTGFFSGLLQTAGGFLAANVIGDISSQVSSFVSNAFADARATQTLMAQTQAVIQSTGGAAGFSAQQVADLASSLSDAAGKSLFGDDQIQAGENLLLTFTNIKETLPDATKIMVDMAQAMGTDVKGGAIQLGKALNDPINGISALSRVGVTFTDEQKAQIKAMQDAGNMAGAQRVILAELNKEFGGSAEAAAKATGGWSEFQGRLGEAGEAMATALLPVLGKLGGMLLDQVMPAVEQAATWLGENLPSAIDQVIAVAGPVIGAFQSISVSGIGLGAQIDDLASIWTALQPVVSAVVNATSAVVSSVFGQVQAFLHAHGDDIRSFLQSTWSQISEIIKLAIQLIQATIVPALQSIAAFINAHGAEIQAVLSAAWTIIKSTIDAALAIITGILKVALAVIHGDWAGAWDAIKEMVSRVWGDIKQIFDAELSAIKNVLSMAWDTIKGQVASAWEGIKGTIASAWESIKSGVSSKVNELAGIVNELPGRVAGVGEAIVSAIWGGIRAKWDSLVQWFSSKLDELRSKLPFSEPKDTSSPLYGLGKSGEAIVGMIQQGIGRAAPLSVGAPLIGGASGGVRTPSAGGGSAGARGGVGGGDTYNCYFPQRGPSMSASDLERMIEQILEARGRRGSVNIRTGAYTGGG